MLGTPEGNGNGCAPGISRPTVRQQILTLSPILKAATRVRNRQAQVAVELTSSPYKDELLQKLCIKGKRKRDYRGMQEEETETWSWIEGQTGRKRLSQGGVGPEVRQ